MKSYKFKDVVCVSCGADVEKVQFPKAKSAHGETHIPAPQEMVLVPCGHTDDFAVAAA